MPGYEAFDHPIRIGDGTLYALCSHGSRHGQEELQMWRQFSTRVDSLSGEWVAELQALSQKWRHSRGYFVPDEEAVEMRLSALRRIASSLSALVEDLEDNAKWTKPVQFFLSYSHKDEGLATSLVSDPIRVHGVRREQHQ